MISEDAIFLLMKKTNRTPAQATKYLETLKERADRQGYTIKNPANSPWKNVSTWRDKTTGIVLWVVDDVVVNVILGKNKINNSEPY